MAKLVVLSEGLTGRTYELKVEKTSVGRVEDNAFHLPEASVSSHHCEIILRGNDIIVRDLNSTNGTFINGERISEAPLKPGQILRLGQIEIRLEDGAAQAAAAGKKQLDHTRVISQGVKLNDFDQGTRQVSFDKQSPFAKKSNKVAKIFITIGIILAVIIAIFFIVALSSDALRPQQ